MPATQNGDLPRLLIVEDDPGLQAQLRWAWEEFEVICATDRDSALAAFASEKPDVVTLDLGLPPDPDGTSEGMAVLDAIMSMSPDTKVIVASGHEARESALQAIARGAYDFYAKPVKIEELALIVRRALYLNRLEAENRKLAALAGDERRVLGSIVTGSPEMVRVARTVERAASADIAVLLQGPSGSGKGLLAHGLHDASPRKDQPFVTLNCAAIPEERLEDELFGTGGSSGRVGQADGGTLFLDELGDMPSMLQVRLLRFLEERATRGGHSPDIRIVAATNRDMEAMIADGQFRQDLYFRLAEAVVTVPPLCERPGDVPLLARHFLHRFASELNGRARGFVPEALAALDDWHWPGNVRELENRVRRAVIMADQPMLSVEDLDLASPDEALADALNLKSAREQVDRKLIRQALARTEGNISSTARILGISRPTLYDLMRQHDLSA